MSGSTSAKSCCGARYLTPKHGGSVKGRRWTVADASKKIRPCRYSEDDDRTIDERRFSRYNTPSIQEDA